MTKTIWSVVLIGTLLVGAFFVTRNHIPSELTVTQTASSTDEVTVLPYGTVTLAVGEMAIFQQNSIKLVGVTEDSRCATGNTCIWAGTLKAQIISVSGSGTSTMIIELGKSITTEAEIITLVSATPYPQAGSQLPQSAYRLTFEVNKRETTVTQGRCYVGGCSSEVCSDKKDVASNCIYREAFACYKTATCERQQNGECGWTQTATLRACIASSL